MGGVWEEIGRKENYLVGLPNTAAGKGGVIGELLPGKEAGRTWL